MSLVESFKQLWNKIIYPEVVEPQTEHEEVCCGQHATCEKDSLLAAVSKDVEYFDDEELDQYKGRSSSDYSDEESTLFQEVLYTMQEKEIPAWIRSLQLRQIELPDQIKDEVLLIVSDQRAK